MNNNNIPSISLINNSFKNNSINNNNLFKLRYNSLKNFFSNSSERTFYSTLNNQTKYPLKSSLSSNTKRYLKSNFGFDINNISQKHKYDNFIIFEKREIEKYNNIKVNHKKTNSLNLNNLSSKNNFFNLTEYLNSTSNIIFNNNNNNSNISNNYNSIFKQINNDQKLTSSQYSTNILNLFEKIHSEEKKKTKSERNTFTKLTKKNKFLNNYNIKSNNLREYINKTRDVKLLKYIQTKKNNIIKTKKENYLNKIQLLDKNIQKLTKAKELFFNKFLIKFNEYVRFLNFTREQQRSIDEDLIDKIIKLKREISSLENNISKLQSEKHNLDRWMYLQIKFKEKKLNLPNYYRDIIDGNNSLIPKDLKTEEIERIKKYKNSILFSADEFCKYIKDFEFSIFKMINKVQNINKENNYLLETSNKIKKSLNKINVLFNNDIAIKEKNLFNIKQKFNQLTNEKFNILKENKSDVNVNIKKRRSVADNNYMEILTSNNNNTNKNNNNKNTEKNKNLFLKIQSIANRLNYLFPNFNINEKLNISVLTKEEEILNLLKKIEFSLDSLFTLDKKYQIKYKEQYFVISLNYEKQKKIKKANLQRELLKERIDLLQAKIEERNNKIYILPRKKVEINYVKFVKKRNHSHKNNIEKKLLNIEDFMYDIHKD